MSDGFRPMRAYLLDDDYKTIIGRFKFKIAGCMADGTNCWYKCDDNGDIIDYDRWYSMARMNGKMIAFLEAIG